ncbi:uncharacterized protein LOC114933488 [Nylanderia fulva]|uniref:uncharacterized protein LOC114933488 n=1 Tax=Nylanderia fulva TaxID=613905 RepID=UPI0010FB9006|nr:uncharacterized protein LOC114933488 [Nylanderia fulva]
MSDKKLANGIVAFSKEEYDDYQKSLSSKKEWPGINASSGSQMTLNTPMLIMELYRLVPYKEGRYVHFHPFNMPYIKVRKIELVGIVTNVKRNVNHLFLTIEDGTGVVEINYKLEQYLFSLQQRHGIDQKYRDQAENLKETVIKNCPKKFPETRPRFSYPCNTSLQNIAILENKWWLETDSGLLGKEVQPFDYVYIIGYPCLDTKFQKIPEQITTEFIEHAKLTVFAMSVVCISEETYNKKLSTWISNTIRQRYKENIVKK